MRAFIISVTLVSQLIGALAISTASCGYGLGTSSYTCYLSANIASEYDPLVITGDHVEGYGDKDVTYIYSQVFPIITELSGAILDKFPNLIGLTFTSVSITRISANSFRTCDHLESVELGINWISAIPSRVFQHCQRLASLSMFNNEIYAISEEAFTGLVKLEQLSLSGNRLTEIGKNSFIGLVRLRYLFLRENAISKIHPEAFDDLGNLNSLDLGDNRLTTIDSRLFLHLTNLVELGIQNNQLLALSPTMFANFPSLKTLDLSGTGLVTIPMDTFSLAPNLTNLNLADNHFTTTDDIPGVFNVLTKLTWLSLRGNTIERLNSGPFRRVPDIGRLFIDNCGINEIEPNFFESFRNLSWLGTVGNRCIDRDFRPFDSSSVTYFQQCFDNWKIPS